MEVQAVPVCMVHADHIFPLLAANLANLQHNRHLQELARRLRPNSALDNLPLVPVDRGNDWKGPDYPVGAAGSRNPARAITSRTNV